MKISRTSSRRTARRRRTDGARTHATILELATRVASVEGIHGLTLGRLAEALGVSKSGLYAHFGSKQRLQLETIQAAQSIFEREVVRPALAAPEGLRRLEALCEAYLSYVERWVFPGGCFFASLLADADARSGRIHEVVVSLERARAEQLAELVLGARRRRELAPEVDAKQLAFELNACLDLANYHFVLFRDAEVLERARRAVKRILEGGKTKSKK